LTRIFAVPHGRRNYFDLFGLPTDFAIDASALAAGYRDWHDTTHPDAGDDDSITPGLRRGLSEIERAYRTLLDPIARAAHLVELLADPVHDPDRQTRQHADLITELDLRECRVEASNRPDAAAEVATLLTSLAEQAASLEKKLQHLLAEPSRQNLAAACEVLRTLRHVESHQREAAGRGAQ